VLNYCHGVLAGGGGGLLVNNCVELVGGAGRLVTTLVF